MRNLHNHDNKMAKCAAMGVLLVLPLLLQSMGDHWVRIADTCLLYVMMALGMNIVVGYAGLLDLGYVAFYAVGAYLFALLASPHLSEQFAWLAAMLPAGLHTPWWVTIPLAAVLAAFFGTLLGTPTLKLRGDYLAIVTLGFGEIVRICINNLGHPVNITNGARGLGQIDSIRLFGLDLGKPLSLGGYGLSSVTLYYYLFLVLTVFTVFICYRLQDSRIGRAWMAIRDDEVAAEAMGINTRNMKLLAFGLGWRHVCLFPGLCVARVIQLAGVGDDCGYGGVWRYRPHPWRDLGGRAIDRFARSTALCRRPPADHDR
jgi:branched-chain amino acid transport system permease protein